MPVAMNIMADQVGGIMIIGYTTGKAHSPNDIWIPICHVHNSLTQFHLRIREQSLRSNFREIRPFTKILHHENHSKVKDWNKVQFLFKVKLYGLCIKYSFFIGLHLLALNKHQSLCTMHCILNLPMSVHRPAAFKKFKMTSSSTVLAVPSLDHNVLKAGDYFGQSDIGCRGVDWREERLGLGEATLGFGIGLATLLQALS